MASSSTLILIASLVVTCWSTWGVKGQDGGFRQPGDYCLSKGDEGCSPEKSLICKSGVCTCEYPWMVFDQDRKACLVSVNQVCDYSLKLYCVLNSQCLDNGEGTGEHVCVCAAGFVQKAVRHCDETFDPDVIKHPWICCKDPGHNFTADGVPEDLIAPPLIGSDDLFITR